MYLGNKIQQLRKQKNLTQAELAEQLSISPQAVSKWENGQSEPDFNTINKMCKIFGISISEFSNEENVAVTNRAEGQKVTGETKIINGYCEVCKKPVGPGEYEIELTHSGAVSTQHVYCKDCHKNIKTNRLTTELTNLRKDRNKGLGWGISVGAIMLMLFIISTFSTGIWTDVLIGLFVSVALFTFISQVIWDKGMIADMFDFFCHSFKAPFGLIFELSLDGIIWLLTVKLVLWIVCGILSILWFILGLIICIPLSIFSWIFVCNGVNREIRETNEKIENL